MEKDELSALISLMRENGVVALTIPNKVSIQLGPAPLRPSDQERDKVAASEAARQRMLKNLFG